jgi:hypothetical protein
MIIATNLLATAICDLAERLPRIHATFADIDEVDILARALVALHDQVPPPPSGNLTIAYWENRIALLLTMLEALGVLAARQRDGVVLDTLQQMTDILEPLLHRARLMRQMVKRVRTKEYRYDH